MSCSGRASIPSTSTEYVRAQVTRWSGTAADPTQFSVDFAFTAPRAGEPVSWHPGDWQVVGSRTFARVLIGPDSGIVLAEGRYGVWIRINAEPEHPVREIGSLEISR